MAHRKFCCIYRLAPTSSRTAQSLAIFLTAALLHGCVAPAAPPAADLSANPVGCDLSCPIDSPRCEEAARELHQWWDLQTARKSGPRLSLAPMAWLSAFLLAVVAMVIDGLLRGRPAHAAELSTSASACLRTAIAPPPLSGGRRPADVTLATLILTAYLTKKKPAATAREVENALFVASRWYAHQVYPSIQNPEWLDLVLRIRVAATFPRPSDAHQSGRLDDPTATAERLRAVIHDTVAAPGLTWPDAHLLGSALASSAGDEPLSEGDWLAVLSTAQTAADALARCLGQQKSDPNAMLAERLATVVTFSLTYVLFSGTPARQAEAVVELRSAFTFLRKDPSIAALDSCPPCIDEFHAAVGSVTLALFVLSIFSGLGNELSGEVQRGSLFDEWKRWVEFLARCRDFNNTQSKPNRES